MNKKNLINIKGLNELNDPYYRYKMEEVNTTYQGNKTIFTNIDSVCGSLKRKYEFLTKFLKKKIGTSCEYKNNSLIIAKNITKNDLQEIIFKFIDEFVLCAKCGNPETLYCEEKKSNYLDCCACGYHTKIK